MTKTQYLAFDLGAESGRAILGQLDEGKLQIRELSRFPNGMLNVLGNLHWNLFRLFEEMKKGLQLGIAETDSRLVGLSIDTWGVDFGLLGKDGSVLGLPFAYRDSRTDGIMDVFFTKFPRESLYQLTGIQMLPFNSIFQLFSMVHHRSPILDAASDVLFMPDLFNYLFTGKKQSEFTIATTSQLVNPSSRDWDHSLISALDLPISRFQKIVPSGTVIGGLREDIANETGIKKPLSVISCASHDTGSAVAAVPAEGEDWAYISSGTWSLMGIEIKSPNISDKAMTYNFTNEGGVKGTIRFLKNIMGLWLIQQCKKSWDPEHTYSYGELAQVALEAPRFKVAVDPDFSGFLNPPDMPEAIRQYCRDSGQQAPDSHGEIVGCALESLAFKYRLVLDQLREIFDHPINKIHVIGGGSENEVLCQFTANATGLQVKAGPSEATAIGNILVQAMALNQVSSLSVIRQVVRNSFPTRSYEPQDIPQWERGYKRFLEICKSTNG